MPDFNYQDILDTYRDLVNEANVANEERYGNILDVIDATQDQVGSTYDRVGELLATIGDTEMRRIGTREDEQLAESEQSLMDRGLYNTTVRDTTRRGIREDADEARLDVQNQVAQQKAGVLQNLAGQQSQLGRFEASMMERRTDQGPDTGMMAQLLQQAGAGEAQQEAAGGFQGLSTNARAGRDAFGEPMGGGSGGASAGGDPSFGSGGGSVSPGNEAQLVYPNRGGSGGGGAAGGASPYDVDTNPYAPGHQSAFGGVRGAIGSATNQAVSSSGGGGGGGTLGIGGRGDNVGVLTDDLFQGQPVFSRGDEIGTYAGGGQTDLKDDLNLLGQGGEIDPNRIPEEQGGNADTPDASGGRLGEAEMEDPVAWAKSIESKAGFIKSGMPQSVIDRKNRILGNA